MRRVKNTRPRRWPRDRSGGALVLRGTNVSGAAKGRPDRLPPEGRDDFVRLRDELGMNAIRLLCFWEAVEPERGIYDADYLRCFREVADAASDAGLHVVVDMHQDLWGRGLASAGAPEWTCDPRSYEGFRPPRGLGWFAGYFTPQVVRCFDTFWGDIALQDAFAAAWARVATALSGVEGILALDLLNEPFWGTHALAPFETRVLPDLYARVTEAVRRAGWDGWVALEPASTANVGRRSLLRPPSRDRVLYTPHFYPPSLEVGLGYAGGKPSLAAQLATLEAVGDRYDIPVIVGEVGVRRGVPGAARYLEDFYDVADARMIGCLQWDHGRGGDGSYALFDRNGGHTAASRAVARPAPSRVAGTPVGWRWSRSDGLFELCWREDGSAQGPTQVAAPRLAFPRGYEARVDDGGEVQALAHAVRIPQRGGERRLVIRAR